MQFAFYEECTGPSTSERLYHLRLKMGDVGHAL
jgi:hypothetical protein